MLFASKPRAERLLRFARAHLRKGDGWIEVSIANASSTGLMVKCSEPPPAGSRVEIRRRGLTIGGEVVWAGQSRFGLASENEIDCEALFAPSDLDTNRRWLSKTGDERRAFPRWWCWQRRRDR
ncbi:MAG: PilZ domain-containing protein [Novosphingobium sp.]|jgi:hypothetical protein|uniref:PilZ domain-containing protein n=1 Tax=Novosphingobium sp. TaxID=1874826 RepID=UPI00391BAF0D